MAVRKNWYVYCDRCSDRTREPARTAREARRIAEGEWWKRVGKRDLCPTCFVAEAHGEPKPETKANGNATQKR